MRKVMCAVFGLFLIGCTCLANGDNVCSVVDDYVIEEHAEIKVTVENMEYGERLIQLWNDEYPSHVNQLQYEVKTVADILSHYLDDQTIDQDVFLTKDNFISTYLNNVLEFDNELFARMEISPVERYYDDIESNIYVPMYAEGMIFSYNATLLNELGYDRDMMGSFEEMTKIEHPQVYYHRNHPYHMYPLLSNGFELYEDHEYAGFDRKEFSNALKSYKEIYDVLQMKDDPSHMDTYFIDQNYVSGLLGSWVQFSQLETTNDIDLRFIKMPTYKGVQLQPYATSYGYMINKNTKYPGASHALLKLIRSISGMQAYVDTSDRYPLIQEEQMENIEFNDVNRKEISLAYLYSQSQPLWKHEYNPTQNVMDIYNKSDILDIVQNYMEDNISLEKAIDQIIEEENTYRNQD